jgi:hypothetical protein
MIKLSDRSLDVFVLTNANVTHNLQKRAAEGRRIGAGVFDLASEREQDILNNLNGRSD